MNPIEVKNPNKYYPLHVHTTTGSIGDSILRIGDYINKAKEIGLNKLAITNHGSMSDMYDFYAQCIDNDIQPIIGCEIYEAENMLLKEGNNYHLVLLAKNKIGLKNLIKLTSDANINGFYRKPRVDINYMKQHGEGIIALSACVGGKIPQMILNGNTDESICDTINDYKMAFDDFYLEIQPGNFLEQILVNKKTIELARETNTKLVVTNDIHYLNREDWYDHDLHVKSQRKMNHNDPEVYPDHCYYFMNYDEILYNMNQIDVISEEELKKAISNCEGIANSIENYEVDSNIKFPKCDVPEGDSQESFLYKLCYKSLNKKRNSFVNPAKYIDRLEYELETICELGYAGYFLVVRDFMLAAKDRNIEVGPGRGSVCGSLVAFLLDITKVDPIKYNLIFERFLSPFRKGSIPDVDVDFESSRRERMFQYVVEKYGKEKCALVSTFGMRKARASIKDTARVFDIDKDLADETSKSIPAVWYDNGEKQTDLDIVDALKVVPELREMQKQYPEWFKMAINLENLPRHTSIHAAGTLISPVDLTDYIPLTKPNNDYIYATSLDLKSAESAGSIKFDFLSLATLDLLHNLKEETNYDFNYANNDYDDEDVWNLIGSKNTTGVFQIASKTYKERMPRLKPTNIEDLANCLALLRSPCIMAKQDELYMQIVEGKKEVQKIHPFYDNATANTNGILLYQEDLMQIFVNFGFTLEDSFKAMKVLSKKKIEKVQAYKNDYYKLAEENNMDVKTADKIWKIIEDASLYLFNKSHAIAYALLVYCTAYYKVHYTNSFLANCLTLAYERKESINETVDDCRRLGIKFEPLNINRSQWKFKANNDKIMIGICAIKSFGEKAYNEIKLKRPFDNFEDFLNKVNKSNCSKRAIVPGIFSGLFSDFNEDRRDLYKHFLTLRKEDINNIIKVQGGGQFDLNEPYNKIEEIILACPLISDPVNDLDKIGFDTLKNNSTFNIRCVIKRVKKLRDRNKEMMAFLTLSTADGFLDAVLFSNNYKQNRSYCKKDLICDIKAIKQKNNSCRIVEIS